MKFLRLTDLDLKNKRVFIRADLNVPQDDAGARSATTPAFAPQYLAFATRRLAGAAVMVTSPRATDRR